MTCASTKFKRYKGLPSGNQVPFLFLSYRASFPPQGTHVDPLPVISPERTLHLLMCAMHLYTWWCAVCIVSNKSDRWFVLVHRELPHPFLPCGYIIIYLTNSLSTAFKGGFQCLLHKECLTECMFYIHHFTLLGVERRDSGSGIASQQG